MKQNIIAAYGYKFLYYYLAILLQEGVHKRSASSYEVCTLSIDDLRNKRHYHDDISFKVHTKQYINALHMAIL